MSTWNKFPWHGLEITVRPKGWRGLPLARKFPLWTGYRLRLSITSRWVSEEVVPAEEVLSLQLRRDNHLDKISVQEVIGIGGRLQPEVNLGHISFSGEYRLSSIISGSDKTNANIKGFGHPFLLELGVAAIEVKRDSILLTPLWVVAGAFMMLAIQWGWERVTEPKTPVPPASQSEKGSNAP